MTRAIRDTGIKKVYNQFLEDLNGISCEINEYKGKGSCNKVKNRFGRAGATWNEKSGDVIGWMNFVK